MSSDFWGMGSRKEYALYLVAKNAEDVRGHTLWRDGAANPRERFEREQIADANLRAARDRLGRSVDYARDCGATDDEIGAALRPSALPAGA